MTIRWRQAAHWIIAGLVAGVGGIWWAKRSLRRRNATVVLMLHRVLDDEQFAHTNSLAGMVVRSRTFEDLVSYCARYKAIDIGSLGSHRAAGLKVAYTFDDGWSDTYDHAFPILQSRGAPMAVFVCPALVGRIAPFWPERIAARMHGTPSAQIETTIERMKSDPRGNAALACEEASCGSDVDSTMTWDQIRELAAAGITFGSHTNTHPILTLLESAAVREEVATSQAALQSRLGRRCVTFAYPNGNHSPGTRRALQEAGIELAFTTRRGAWTPETDPLAIPRANICEDHVTGPAGRFSRAMFNYYIFWNSWRATR